MQDDKLLKVDEVATRLRLSAMGIYRRVALGEIPVIRLGRFIRFSSCDLDDFIKSRRTRVTKAPSVRAK